MNRFDKDQDLDWINKYQQCHQDSFIQLNKKYYSYIYRSFIYRGLPKEDAKDCTQDVCIKLMRALKQFRFESSFKTFLDHAIFNRTCDFYRGMKKRIGLISLYIKLFDDESDLNLIDIIPANENDDPGENDNYRKLIRILKECVAKITKPLQKQLVALWLDGHKRRQMAEMLELPLGTVHGSLARGRDQLRDCIKTNYC